MERIKPSLVLSLSTFLSSESFVLHYRRFYSLFLYYLQKNQPSPKNNGTPSPVKQQHKNKDDILNDIFDSQNDNNDTRSVIDNDDDFNPRDSAYVPIQSQNVNANFGDFSGAFGGSTTTTAAAKTQDNSDEFADFTSAFNSGAKISNDKWTAGPQAQVSLMGSTIPNIGNPLANNPNSGQLTKPAQSLSAEGDLLSTNLSMGSNLLNTMQSRGQSNQNVTRNNANNNAGKKFVQRYYNLL